MGNGYEPEPSGNWVEARRWVLNKIYEHTRKHDEADDRFREIEETVHVTRVDIAVLQAKAAVLGFVGGIVSAGAVSLIVELLLRK